MERPDVVVVGGGHNGLVAAGLLAREGVRVVVLERRPVVGGAAVSERPFGPDYLVTSLSYVVSLLPPSIVRDLQLARHGYHVYPQGPYFAPRADDDRALRLPSDARRRYDSVAQFSRTDAEELPRWDAWLDELAAVMGPLLTAVAPRLGSRRPADLAKQASLARFLRGVDTRKAFDLTKLLTSSIADLVEPRFESDAMRGALAVSGVIGTWAGPRSPGTAYVMAHHHIGDLGDGAIGAWGFPRGGMGGVTQALASAARSFGAEIRTESPVAQILTSADRVRGVVLESGEIVESPRVIATTHPALTFLAMLDPAELPPDFVGDIRGWRSRSGTVKVNLAVDRLPVFRAAPDPEPEVYGGTIVLAESLETIEAAFQQAAAGTPAAAPFADVCIPSVFDRTLAPEGHHVVSMFTQWVPHTWSEQPHHQELEDYADRVVARMEAVAPGFTDSVLHRQVIGPHTMEQEYGLVGGNIFHGELSPAQLFHTRPAAGYADLRTPVRGLYQAGSATHGGGGVTGIPGRNVVRIILGDLRRDRVAQRIRHPRG